ncbi:SprT-like domain-containing protein [Acinetobacter sp. YH01009]|uniref:SprT-like domain-containing protein n=1 Tax=Acinetobacter sp. YH01009 TaxID=2601025 RepID=UPI0015D3E888|nr:SprT-like domain-containing protein [Acinetobacter sp. YH01009]
MTIKNRTTLQFYEELQHVYDTFNDRLFNNELPECLITLQRINKNTGYWSENRFASIDDGNSYTHELALNPDYFGIRPLIDIFQTYAHELCHLKQAVHGTPSKRSYHNAEFSSYMREIGLITSDTGRKGGKETGEKMSDYPLDDGKFIKVCNELVEEGRIIKWYDKYVPKTLSSIEMIQEQIELMELLPSASPKLFHIAHLGKDLNQVLNTANLRKQSVEGQKSIGLITGYGIPLSDEDEIISEEMVDHFDLAISKVDTSDDHVETLGSIFPSAFLDEDPDQSSSEPNVVKIFKGEIQDPEKAVVVLNELVFGETIVQEIGSLDDELPKKKKQTRESFTCPDCGRGALCAPTFRLTCTDCQIELVLSSTVDKKLIKQKKKAAEQQGESE